MSELAKEITQLLSKEEQEALLAFHDILTDVFSGKIKKIVLFGRQNKTSTSPSLDVFILGADITKEDLEEIDQIAEDISESSAVPIAPILMDPKTYQQYQKENHPIVQDILKTGHQIFKAS